MVEINLQNQWLETNKRPFHWSIKQGRSNPRWVKWEPQGGWNCSFYLFHYTIYPFTGWWFGTCFMIFPYIGNFIFPNWRTHIFQRGRAQPPTSLGFFGVLGANPWEFSSMVTRTPPLHPSRLQRWPNPPGCGRGRQSPAGPAAKCQEWHGGVRKLDLGCHLRGGAPQF